MCPLVRNAAVNSCSSFCFVLHFNCEFCTHIPGKYLRTVWSNAVYDQLGNLPLLQSKRSPHSRLGDSAPSECDSYGISHCSQTRAPLSFPSIANTRQSKHPSVGTGAKTIGLAPILGNSDSQKHRRPPYVLQPSQRCPPPHLIDRTVLHRHFTVFFF